MFENLHKLIRQLEYLALHSLINAHKLEETFPKVELQQGFSFAWWSPISVGRAHFHN